MIRPVAVSAGKSGHWAMLGLLAVCWGFFAWAAARGFSLGDDANYLMEAAQAGANRVSLSQYAHVWHPLFLLVDGNAFAYRLGGFLVLQLFAILFGHALARFCGMEGRDRGASVLVCAITSCCFYNLWLPTPNYNLLNLCGILAFFSALLLASGRQRPDPGPEEGASGILPTAALAGLGLALAFLSKPPSFALAAVAGIFWTWGLALAKPTRRLIIAGLTAAAALLLVAFLVDGGVFAFIARIREGMQFLNVRASQGQGYGLVNSVVGPLMPERRWKLPPVIGLSLLLLAPLLLHFFMLAKGRLSSLRFGLLLSLVCFLVGIATFLSRALDGDPERHFPFNHLWYLVPMLAFGAAFAMVGRLAGSRTLLAVLVILSGLLIFAFGTNSTLIRQMSGASVFWFAGLLMLRGFYPPAERARYMASVLALAGAMTVALLAGMSVSPLRNDAPLWEQDTVVMMGHGGGELRLSRPFADYVTAFQREAAAEAFEQGNVILDFAAQGPGMAYALGGAAPGQVWLTFGRPNDALFARYALSGVPRKTLLPAWILTGRPHTERMAEETLSAMGLKFPDDYRLVLARKGENGMEHKLWRPRSP